MSSADQPSSSQPQEPPSQQPPTQKHPPLSQRSKSTTNISSQHGDEAPRHKHKQFVVSRHHNPRVPSYGRGLNKLGKLAAATGGTPPKSKTTTTPRHKTTFELGSPASDDEGSEDALPPIAPQIQRTASNNTRLQKSSSTRSLDAESRKHRATRRVVAADRTERARSKSGDRKLRPGTQKRQTSDESRDTKQSEERVLREQIERRMLQAIPKEQEVQQDETEEEEEEEEEEQQENDRSEAGQIWHDRLTSQTRNQGARTNQQPHQLQQVISPSAPSSPPHQMPQPIPPTSTNPVYNPPITPSHSLPTQEPLTSRFISATSPSSAADSTPRRDSPGAASNQGKAPTTPLQRSSSTYSTGPPSRTQQKLLLQRAAADKDAHLAMLEAARGSGGVPQFDPHQHPQFSQHPQFPGGLGGPGSGGHPPHGYPGVPATYLPSPGPGIPAHPIHHPVHPGAGYMPHIHMPISAQQEKREYERVAREYGNVRRFRNPVVEAVERRRGWVIRREGGSGDMGLSRSLGNEGRLGQLKEQGTGMDEQSVMDRMWRRSLVVSSNNE